MEKFPSIVEDVMSSPIITIDSESMVRDAALIMADRHIGSIIVIERGEAVGIVTKRDMLERVVAPCRDVCTTRMKEIMSSPLISVPPKVGILEAMRKMREHNISRLVVKENDRLLGIITERDVIRAMNIASLTSFTTILRKK
ncbi:CBS domain-containing protein [Candidatus Bathyarchaeota archaeon]|nr:CBS domain-containing protein [Candidatus Bathyarchaeota archaeon]MBS7630364.1 CBS domain-containing protein [Candidatus Bathyarchaeota archaeon]